VPTAAFHVDRLPPERPGAGESVTFQDLGSIGEFVAALATVATLIYLAVQIRQNTSSLRANAYQDTVRSSNDWAAFFVHHPETNTTFLKGITDPRSLDKAEALEFTHLIEIYLRNYSAAQKLANDGLIPAGPCNAYESALRKWFASPELRDWWKTRNPGYGRLVESLIDAQQGAAADVEKPV
jgi:hypothetical protein